MHFISRVPEGLNVYASSVPAALKKLNPIVIQGILRVGGRLEKASIDYDACHPIILPHVSHLTDIIINHFHVFSGHSGISTTLNSLFQQFWVVKPTSVVKRVLANCMYCRRRNAKPGEQIMAELPPARLQMNSHPFAYTGVDYFGPLMIRQKRSNIKRYGCLFTCLTTRAVHLEVSVDLSSDAFINALRRFLSRRGPVVHIYSDNGTNLVGAERILRESLQQWNQHQIHDFLLQNEIQWTFNPPTASHMGGAWERTIRSVRRILTSLTANRTLNDDQLHTFLLEAEAILNSRPLTPVTIDPEGAEPLTPYHLLKLNPTGNLPPTITDGKDCYSKRRWCHVQFLADRFWSRWSKEYLRTIISRQKWLNEKPNFNIGDIVLVITDNAPRSQWTIGKICAIEPDEQEIVRKVVVSVKGNRIRRPIHKLCLLIPNQELTDDKSTDAK